MRHTSPGFAINLGYSLFWLGLIVLLPLFALLLKSADMGPLELFHLLTAPRTLAALRLSFGGALLAAAVNLIGGLWVAWALTRYRFPGRRLLDAMIDLPFALPTAVAGVALTALFEPHGWLGYGLATLGIRVAYTPLGVLVAMAFVGFPFVVRTLQPVLHTLEREAEEAAHMLGASRVQTFCRVIIPMLAPALLTGFALALARGVGEYGSVIFIAGNIPGTSEIAPLLIVQQLEQFNYPGAAAIGIAMLVISLLLLLTIGRLQQWSRRWAEAEA